MNLVLYGRRIVVVSDSAREAIELAVHLNSIDTFKDRYIHSLYPPFSNAALEIMLETLLECHEIEGCDTEADYIATLTNLRDDLSIVRDILSYVREAGDHGLDLD